MRILFKTYLLVYGWVLEYWLLDVLAVGLIRVATKTVVNGD